MEQKRKILYVDDEVVNIQLFSLNFKSVFEVYTTCYPEDALAIILNNDIQVVVTDYKMPKINGMELIDSIKNVAPHVVCLILSAYIENIVVTDKEKVFKYIMKPYKKAEMLSYINEAFAISDNALLGKHP